MKMNTWTETEGASLVDLGVVFLTKRTARCPASCNDVGNEKERLGSAEGFAAWPRDALR